MLTCKRPWELALILAGGLALSGGYASAANIVASNESDPHPITLTSGTPIPDGTGFVAVGSFTLSDVQITNSVTSAASFSALVADFQSFGSAVDFGVAGEGGLFSDSFTQGIGAGDPLVGGSIFLVAGNGNELATSDQLWVFKTGESFAADAIDPFSARIELDAEIGAGSVLVGTPTTAFLPIAGETFAGSEMVAIIPEPGAASLLGAVSLMLLVRRRR